MVGWLQGARRARHHPSNRELIAELPQQAAQLGLGRPGLLANRVCVHAKLDGHHAERGFDETPALLKG